MKDKIINFLLIFLLIFLVLSMFSNPEKSDTLTGWIVFDSLDTPYAKPNAPKLSIINNSPDNISLNSCDDIKIKVSWNFLNIRDTFCSDITINSWESFILDYNSEFNSFSELWKYYFIINHNDKEYISQFDIWVSWFIKKFFIWVFYAPLYNIMAFLITITWYSLFWAIILITILIRILLILPQHKMMKNQRQMQIIQPKIKEIQTKYKWNNQMLWVELMKLYKKEKVNPMWSCWLLLIQMPILIVVYHIIISIEDPSNVFYIYSFLPHFDLSNLITVFRWFDLLSIWGIQWLVLALVVAFLQFLQVKLSLLSNETPDKWIVLEKKKWEVDYSSMMPDPEVMNKFMLIGMPIMVWIFTYTFFAWVWIYWGISTLFMIFQQLVVNNLKK